MRRRSRSLLVAAYLLLCILLGGSAQGLWRNLVLQLLGIALIVWAASRPEPSEEDNGNPVVLYGLLGLGVLVVLVQLVPLPPDLWTALPGRSAIAEAYAAIGADLPWLPVSVAPYRSVLTLFAIIPGLAMFVGIKLLRPSPRWIALAIAAGMLCSIALGAVQVASGTESAAYLYPIHNVGAVGVFANANHMGTLLLVSIPFAAALLVSSKSDRGGSTQGRIAVGIAALILVTVGIALNGSLAAVALAVPVLVASGALVPAATRWRSLALPVAAVTLVAAVALVALTPIGGMASNLGPDSSVQGRSAIWRTTARAIGESFPVGTGLGTFEPVYRQYEDPAAVTSEYVNHAHNDYLELVLELGAAGAVLIVLFLGWWAVAATRVWTSTLSTPFGRAATIATAAILAHSIVDYPLRTGALMAVFGAAIALMAQRSRSAPENKRSDLRPARHVKLG